MATGIHYTDTMTPHFVSDLSAVTLSTTAKALHTAADCPTAMRLGGFFDRSGKAIRVTAFGKITTDTTPGNGSFRIYWGTGADANGTLLMTGGSFALAASQTNLSWWCEFVVRCITPGSSGSLYCTGIAHLNSSLMSTPAPVLLPPSAAAAVSSLDLTTAGNVVSLQFLRSGSTVETMTVQDLRFESLN